MTHFEKKEMYKRLQRDLCRKERHNVVRVYEVAIDFLHQHFNDFSFLNLDRSQKCHRRYCAF